MSESDVVNPDDFIITRKRKKYRFARFANASNCYEFAEWTARQTPDDQPHDVVMEVGAGTGLFSVELAARHPDRLYIAVDVKADRLQKGAYAALERGITNVVFVRARADQVTDIVPAHSLSQVWVTFADPFPRKRSAGRRMTHSSFLDRYQTVLASEGSLLIKHDNRDFFCWTLEQLIARKWHIVELSFDLHDSPLPDEYKTLTTYEQRWLSEGGTINFVRAQVPQQ